MSVFADEIKRFPPVYEPERAQLFYDDLLKASADDETLAPLRRILRAEGPAQQLVFALMGLSPYLRSIMVRQPQMLQACLTVTQIGHLPELCKALEQDIAAATAMPEAMKLLRRFKQNAALAIALYDAAAVAPVDEIVRLITETADCAVRQSLAFLFRRARDNGQLALEEGADPVAGSGYFVLGMGKHGGFELNYSSDIDLIVFYDKERRTLAPNVEEGKFFVRLTHDLVKLMNERTADGYVFRTDLRLRPDPGATQVAISSEAALVYYENYGQNWERAAMIKARVVAGDIEAGKQFIEQLSPYIWRKYLDFATINDIHAMKRQIHAFKGHAEIAVAGHNIKLGRGGIREIEFFVQTQQLIAGGRHPELRGRQTLANLQKLAAMDWISMDAATELSAAYRFLRHVEHRLQMVNDEQTQTLPKDENELLRIARFAGFETPAAFADALVDHLEKVQSHYAALFEHVPELTDSSSGGDLVFTGDEPDQATVENLTRKGFSNPVGIVKIVQDWHRARYPAMRSARAREALTELTPLLIDELAATSNPDVAFVAFDGFLKRLPAGVQLFSLLRANPRLLRLLAVIMGTAPRLANTISHRAKVLDAVLDPSFFGAMPSEEELQSAFDQALSGARDYSEALDLARIVGQEQAFLVGVRVLSDTISPDQAGEAYAAIAGNAIAHIHRAAREEVEMTHGHFSSGGSCIMAMGKMGGREMTASSDLDLIMVYDHPSGESSSSGGRRPLMASQYFNRLTQRLITGLSAPTPEGTLYEVDMRLRPSGNAGPVATSLESFSRYQRNEAWTWEHMALTRARLISGPPELLTHIEAVMLEVLCMPRDAVKIAADVVDMRERIFKEKGSGELWEIKQARGGLIDLEFTAQYLQLVHAHDAHDAPEVLDQNTSAAFRKLATAGKLDWGDAEFLIEATWLMHCLTQILRLCYDKRFVAEEAPEGLRQLLCHATDSPDFAHLEARLKETQAGVHERFKRLVGQPVGA